MSHASTQTARTSYCICFHL